MRKWHLSREQKMRGGRSSPGRRKDALRGGSEEGECGVAKGLNRGRHTLAGGRRARWRRVSFPVVRSSDVSKKSGRRAEWVTPRRRRAYDQRYMKRCPASLTIREVQIKATVRCHFGHVRMAILKHTRGTTCCQRCGERGIPMHCWGECKQVQPP